jgi:hypothetical protein
VSIGDELSWLPPKVLMKWWKQWSHELVSKNTGQSSSSSSSSSMSYFLDDMNGTIAAMTDNFERIQLKEVWCDGFGERKRPFRPSDYDDRMYKVCNLPIQQQVDTLANSMFVENVSLRRKNYQTRSESVAGDFDWSPVYASMPVLRITMLREPFSWLMSKYAWHHHSLFRPGTPKSRIPQVICHDIALATSNISSFSQEDFFDGDRASPGFARRMPLEQLFKICGSDCQARYYSGITTLNDIERQASNNLRNSFAVVGLLEETSLFFEMITARVAYLDTSLNAEVEGKSHPSPKGIRYQRCQDLYSNPSFQLELLKASPELAALLRVYQVGKEVNRQQLEELRSCSKLPLGRGI